MFCNDYFDVEIFVFKEEVVFLRSLTVFVEIWKLSQNSHKSALIPKRAKVIYLKIIFKTSFGKLVYLPK